MTQPLWITGGLLVNPGERAAEVRRGTLVIGNGRIVAVHPPEVPPPAGAAVLDASQMVVLPGLVNGHVHSHGVLSKWLVDGMPLEIWSPYVAAGRYRLTPEEARLGATLVAVESLRAGVTAVLDHPVYDHEGLDAAAEAYLRVGIRAALAPAVMDLPYAETIPAPPGVPVPSALQATMWVQARPDPRGLLDLTRRCLVRWHGAQGRLTVMAGPSAPQRCSDDLLRGLARLAADTGTGVHTHLLETKAQALVAARRYGRPVTAHLEALGLLSPSLSVAHAVWVSAGDVQNLARAGVTVVHNPISNLTLGSGIMPLTALREGGVPLALGTDSPNSGGHHAVWESMRLAAALPRALEGDDGRWPTAEESLYWATRGGARALGMGGEIGALEVGKAADLVLLRIRTAALTPLNDVVRQLVFCERGESVDTVLVAGRVVLRAGRLRTINEAEVLAQAAQAAERLRARSQAAFADARRLEAFTRAAYAVARDSPAPRPWWQLCTHDQSGTNSATREGRGKA